MLAGGAATRGCKVKRVRGSISQAPKPPGPSDCLHVRNSTLVESSLCAASGVLPGIAVEGRGPGEEDVQPGVLSRVGYDGQGAPLERRELASGGRTVDLPYRQFEALRALVEAGGAVAQTASSSVSVTVKGPPSVAANAK